MSRMTGELFIGDHVQLNIGFAAARTRLGNLASCGVLLGASERAYGETITGLADAGVNHEIVCWFAAAAVRVFLARLACALVHPSGAAPQSPGGPGRSAWDSLSG